MCRKSSSSSGSGSSSGRTRKRGSNRRSRRGSTRAAPTLPQYPKDEGQGLFRARAKRDGGLREVRSPSLRDRATAGGMESSSLSFTKPSERFTDPVIPVDPKAGSFWDWDPRFRGKKETFWKSTFPAAPVAPEYDDSILRSMDDIRREVNARQVSRGGQRAARQARFMDLGGFPTRGEMAAERASVRSSFPSRPGYIPTREGYKRGGTGLGVQTQDLFKPLPPPFYDRGTSLPRRSPNPNDNLPSPLNYAVPNFNPEAPTSQPSRAIPVTTPGAYYDADTGQVRTALPPGTGSVARGGSTAAPSYRHHGYTAQQAQDRLKQLSTPGSAGTTTADIEGFRGYLDNIFGVPEYAPAPGSVPGQGQVNPGSSPQLGQVPQGGSTPVQPRLGQGSNAPSVPQGQQPSLPSRPDLQGQGGSNPGQTPSSPQGAGSPGQQPRSPQSPLGTPRVPGTPEAPSVPSPRERFSLDDLRAWRDSIAPTPTPAPTPTQPTQPPSGGQGQGQGQQGQGQPQGGQGQGQGTPPPAPAPEQPQGQGTPPAPAPTPAPDQSAIGQWIQSQPENIRAILLLMAQNQSDEDFLASLNRYFNALESRSRGSSPSRSAAPPPPEPVAPPINLVPYQGWIPSGGSLGASYLSQQG